MFTIVVSYSAILFRDLNIKEEIVFDRDGQNSFICNSKEQAEEYLKYLQLNYAFYGESSQYRIMELKEITNA